MTKRNALIKHALCNPTIHELIQIISCIPVKDSKILRKPSELVNPIGKASTLFHIDDHRFPDGKFETFSDILSKFGMMNDTVTDEIIVERAYTVHELYQKR